MNVPLISDTFFKQLCDTYAANEPLLANSLKEYKAVRMGLAMLRAAAECSEECNPEFVAFLNRVLAYLEDNHRLVIRLHTIAKQANAIQMEHCE